MIKNLLQLYSLLSCLIYTILCLIFAGFLLNHSTIYFFPDLKYRSYPYHFDSNSEYLEHHKHQDEFYKELKKKSDNEIIEMRLQQQKEWEKRENKKTFSRSKEGMIYHGQWLFLSLVFLVIHWGIYKKSSKPC